MYSQQNKCSIEQDMLCFTSTWVGSCRVIPWNESLLASVIRIHSNHRTNFQGLRERSLSLYFQSNFAAAAAIIAIIDFL